MYPTAYTLTVLVLTLLQYSFDKRYAKNACQNGATNQNGTGTLKAVANCTQSIPRKEIRQLSRQEFDNFILVFNEYSTRNDTDELNANINELGAVQIFDELLQSKRMLTPYWEYRLELSADRPESSALWWAPQFQAVKQATDAQWLVEFIENENAADDDEFFGDDPFSQLWQRRRRALKVMREMRRTDVFWHLLLLVSIETGADQEELKINRTACLRDFGKFTRWVNESCEATLSDGENCRSSSDCYARRCSKSRCQSTSPTRGPLDEKVETTQSTTATARPIIWQELRAVATTPSTVVKSTAETTIGPKISEAPTNSSAIVEKSAVEQKTDLLNEKIEQEVVTQTPTTPIPLEEKASELTEDLKPTDKKTEVNKTEQPTTRVPPTDIARTTSHHAPTAHLEDILSTQAADEAVSLWSAKMAATTEFLANELNVPPKTNDSMEGIPKTGESRQKLHKKKKRKFGKKNRKTATTTPQPHEQIPPTNTYAGPTLSLLENNTLAEEDSTIEPESYGTETLDALLPYLPTPKVPTMILWNSRMSLRVAYFGFTVIEGNLGKQRRLKDKGHKRAKGVRIYLKGLDMPSGYTQVTQGRQMRTGTGALARTLHPDDNEPFVEFKMRVENRYGTPCKQMCLDSHQRYRRCARRTIRLSPYKKFSDPIAYFDNESRAMDGQWTGRGYYRKRKPTYLLFKCD